MAQAAAAIVGEIAGQVASEQQLQADAELARLRSEVASLKGRYKAALAQIDRERERADAIAGLAGIKAKPAKPGRLTKSGKGAATVIVALSDWHVEERVDPATVNGLNDYDLDVADRRIAELAERFAVLLEHQRQLVKVPRVVVWLGGDFLSGHIHPDTAELAQLPPLSAIRWAGERIRGFIDMVADMTPEVIVATNSGNHGRSTEKLRVGTELDHSFEQHMYLTMAGQEAKKNVRWQVGEGYLNVVDLDGFRVRFHHGHAVSYGGGVGGITIPTNKAIAAWDRIDRADLTVFGHWHQFSWLRAGRYVSNGSLIGHSAYATKIKASYEPPCQAFVVVDHERREVTDAKPIFTDRDLKQRAAS
jgi:predicted phosphodiesterase